MAQTPSDSQNNSRLLIIAVVVAIAAVIVVNLYIEVVRQQAQPKSFTIYTANRTLAVGDKLKERDYDPVQVPETFQNAFSKAIRGSDISNRNDQVIHQPVAMGEVITVAAFTDSFEDRLDRKIDRGMRAVALPVNSRTLPGTLRPGMYVDIEAPFRGSGGVVQVLPVMENVEVMAVGARSVIDEAQGESVRNTRFSTISIQVSPENATMLSMVQKMAVGDFELHLRRPGDDTTPKIPSGGINPAVVAKIEDVGGVNLEERF